MNLIDKILFVADYIEPGRDQAPRLDRLRKLAFSDLDQCCIFILEDTIQYLKQLNKTVDPTTQKTYHALIRQTGKHETI